MLAVYHFPINVCVACRADHEKENRDVQCDIDQTCSKTGNKIDADDEPMEISLEFREVIDVWNKIVSMSIREQVTIPEKDRSKIYYVPTMEKMNDVLSILNWRSMLNSKADMIHYLSIFHSTYVGAYIGS
jgi:hypothetical protein